MSSSDIADRLEALISIAEQAIATVHRDGEATPAQRLELRKAQEALLLGLKGPLSVDEVDQLIVCPRLWKGDVSDEALSIITSVLDTARRRTK